VGIEHHLLHVALAIANSNLMSIHDRNAT
jgi:hypothetical protein